MSRTLLGSAPAGQENQPRQEADGFVKAALDALMEHIAILDEAGTIIHVNKAWRDFGDANNLRVPNYGIGQNYRTVCEQSGGLAPDALRMAQGIRDVIDHKAAEFSLEYDCHSADEKRWFIARVTRYQWYGASRLIVAHHNVTAFRLAQAAAEENRGRLEAILENLVDGIITFDQDGVIESLNSASAYIFGYDRAEMVGQNVRTLVPALNASPSVIAFVDQISSLGDELEGQRKDGTLFPMYFAISHFTVGEKRLFTAIIQDFTERKYFESELWDKERLNLALDRERELRDLKNRFISMMSHELRTPLASIRLANSMLKMYGDKSTPDEKRESYEAIDQQVDYLNELVGDVMTISRADFTGAEFEAQRIDLETYCRDVIEEISLAHLMQRRIEFSGTNRRIEADVDPKLLRRALTNLLTNAIKYSPDDKPINVSLEVVDGEAIIRVSDQGIGIPEDDLKHLFEPFHRAANVGKIQGTGLGLAIARQAIELHGGTISVESTVGVGTTFTVRLPLPEK
ncbi:MAG: PAS domain-containing sensor histidine kinase [Anaerolineae bacterium]|nr:PAS domain-containing sensor histidine kinase [Anaerolineae bacterium]